MQGADPPTEIPRFPANVVDREVGGERRGPIHWQLGQGEAFDAIDALNVSSDSAKRLIIMRTSPSPTASSALASSGMGSPPVVSGRRAASAQRVAPASALVVPDEAVRYAG